MEKRITITDIATACSVSPGTVHRALNGKPGVGDSLRSRILDYARESGYRPNSVASSLKRRALRVAASFPGPTEENRFFYTYVWQGFRDYVADISDYNVEIIELPYYHSYNNQADELSRTLEEYPGGIDGMITVGHVDARGEAVIRSYIDHSIPVVLVCDDIANCGRLACVQASYDITGSMMAEQICSQIPDGSSVLLIAGDVMVPSHYRVVQGFDHYLMESGKQIRSIKIHGYHQPEALRERIRQLLTGNRDIAAVCSVNARGSVMMAEVITQLGLEGKLRAIGSDIFEENIANLRSGLLTNIVYKSPHRQAWLGTKLLLDYLIRDEKPAAKTLYVDSTLVFRSNLSIYETSNYRTVL